MKVISFSFDKISAERLKNLKLPINVNTDMKIIDVEKSKIDLFENKDVLSFDYQFTITYNEDAAKLFFEGKLTLLMDDKNDKELIKKTIEDWKSKKISQELNISLLKIIFNKCNTKALLMEEFINLPSHIPGPQFSKNEESSENSDNKK